MDDLDRYLSGLSFQATTLLKAAWHGSVYFCTDEDEKQVLHALAKLTVQPPSQNAASQAALDAGAASLLRAFATPLLLEQLHLLEPLNEIESARRLAALELVQKHARPPR